jgi:hypothetical protein
MSSSARIAAVGIATAVAVCGMVELGRAVLPASAETVPRANLPPQPGGNQDNSNHIQGNPGPCSNNGGSGNTVICPTNKYYQPPKPNQHEGVLIPGKGMFKGRGCNPDGPIICIFLGSNMLFLPNNAPARIPLPGGGEMGLDIKPNQIRITLLRIFDDTGTDIIHIDPDGYWVHPDSRMKPRKNKHTLTVYDRKDVEALNLDFINSAALSITGVFRDPEGHLICTITSKESVCGRGTSSNNVIVVRQKLRPRGLLG